MGFLGSKYYYDGAIAKMFQSLYEGKNVEKQIMITATVALAAVVVRFVCSVISSKMGYLSSKAVKKTLREMIYRKLLRLGSSYKEQINTSEIVQVAVEGVDQLETYFGAYLPQFFYAMLAPLILFGCILIILLAADFFLPMRLLGSFFHIAMNGMAASDKIFHLLDLALFGCFI